MPLGDAGSPPVAQFDLTTRMIHLALVVFGLAAALGLRLLWGLAGPRGVRFAEWVPYTGQQFRYVTEDLRSILRFRLPHRATHDGLAGLVQAFGLLSFAWMAATGADIWRKMFSLRPRAAEPPRTPNRAENGGHP